MATQPGSAASREPLLAVLAFDNLSGDPEMTYFSDGVSEEIQQTVARGADLKVLGRTSSFQFRGADKAVRKVVAELKATHILDGSVRRSGSRVRIAAQLIECGTETTLWSDRFDRDLTDIFALQDEIAAAVAEALKRAFAPPPAVGPVDPAAYDLYLRARRTGFGPGPLDGRRRIEALEQITAAAPGLAAAWAVLALARARQMRSRQRGDAYAAMRAGVVEAAETALRLDPGAGAAYTALAFLEPWANFAAREALLQKALAASPNDPDCLIAMTELTFNVGRHGEARAYAARAYDVDPLYMLAVFWRAGMALSAPEGALEAHERFEAFRARWPDEEVLGLSETLILAHLGAWDLLEAAAASIRSRGPVSQLTEQRLDYYLSLRDLSPDAKRAMLDRLGEDIDRTGTVQLVDAILAAVVGLTDEVLAILDRASFAHLFDRDGGPPSGTTQIGGIFLQSGVLAMPNDIRAMRLYAKLGFCDYWIATGHWPDCADHVAYDFRAEARRQAGALGKG
jgi:TolB-like protein